MKNYDAVILGFGKGGKTLAGALAKQGKSVAVIERSAGMYGGTCINVGCIPSKSLVTSAAASALEPDAPFAQKAARYAAAVAEKRRVTALLRGKNYHKLADLDNVDVLDGEGSFVSAHEVRVEGSAIHETIRGEQIFINTGARPVELGIPGLAGNPHVYTSESLMDESVLPRRLTLIGAGYIGMEFASMYSNFGAKVTVLQDGGLFLPREDRDVAQEVQRILEKQGVRFVLGVKVERAEGGNVICSTEKGESVIEGDAILVATGRRANTDALHAENAGVQLTRFGTVKVDGHLRTDAPHIWAMGDVAGSPQFTYVSLDDFRIVRDQLNGTGVRSTADRRNIPYSVFMLATPPQPVLQVLQQAAPQASAASWAIRFAASLEGVITVLSGMSTAAQMEDNLSYMKGFRPLNAAEQQTIRDAQTALRSVPLIPCTSCNYCAKVCPNDIGISGSFAAMNLLTLYGNRQRAQDREHWLVGEAGKKSAAECLKCGACEQVCPQHIAIRAELEKVDAALRSAKP